MPPKGVFSVLELIAFLAIGRSWVSLEVLGIGHKSGGVHVRSDEVAGPESVHSRAVKVPGLGQLFKPPAAVEIDAFAKAHEHLARDTTRNVLVAGEVVTFIIHARKKSRA